MEAKATAITKLTIFGEPEVDILIQVKQLQTYLSIIFHFRKVA